MSSHKTQAQNEPQMCGLSLFYRSVSVCVFGASADTNKEPAIIIATSILSEKHVQ